MGAPDYGAFLRLAADYERVALDTTMVFTGFFDKLAPFPDFMIVDSSGRISPISAHDHEMPRLGEATAAD